MAGMTFGIDRKIWLMLILPIVVLFTLTMVTGIYYGVSS